MTLWPLNAKHCVRCVLWFNEVCMKLQLIHLHRTMPDWVWMPICNLRGRAAVILCNLDITEEPTDRVCSWQIDIRASVTGHLNAWNPSIITKYNVSFLPVGSKALSNPWPRGCMPLIWWPLAVGGKRSGVNKQISVEVRGVGCTSRLAFSIRAGQLWAEAQEDVLTHVFWPSSTYHITPSPWPSNTLVGWSSHLE